MPEFAPVRLSAACRTDPVLIAVCMVAVVAAGWTLFGPAPAAVSWLGQAVLDAIFAWFSWRIARDPGISAPVRRFWRAAVLGGVLFAAGALLQIPRGLGGPRAGAMTVGVSVMILTVAGTACVLWAILAHPSNVTGRERRRLWVDASLTTCAVAVLTWWVSLSGGIRPDTPARIGIVVVGVSLMVVSGLAMVRLLLTGSAPVTLAVGVTIGTAVALIGLELAQHTLLTQAHNTRAILVARLLPSLLLAVTPRIEQLRVRAGRREFGRRRRRAHNHLPYVAVGTTQAILIFELSVGGLTLKAWGTLIGNAVIVALVMVRQGMAFADNAQLLRRLDRSMLQLRRQEQRFRSLVQHAADIIMLVNVDGRVAYASPALERLLGIPPERAIGRPAPEVIEADDASTIEAVFTRVINDPGQSVTAEIRVRHVDGSGRWLELVATNLLADASVSGIIVNVGDVTQAIRLQDQLRHDATHDILTGLGNRALLTERTLRFQDSDGPDSEQVAVLMLDLDDFKKVNDLLGHHVGDELLVVVAERLRTCVRPTDTVARLGGDEFALLIDGASRTGAMSTARRVLSKLSESVVIEGHALTVRASIGIAVGPGRQFDKVLRDADAAMYTAKQTTTGPRMHVSGHSHDTPQRSDIPHREPRSPGVPSG